MKQKFALAFLASIVIAYINPAISLANNGVRIKKVFVLEKSQVPAILKKFKPAIVYIPYDGSPSNITNALSADGETIINLKNFISVTKKVTNYRLIFSTERKIDSAYQFDDQFRITDKAYYNGNNLLSVQAFDTTGKLIDKFTFNFGQKYNEEKKPVPSIDNLLKLYQVYNTFDRNQYAASSVWSISIGINDYKSDLLAKLSNCESDAISYNSFFKKEYFRRIGNNTDTSLFLYNEYLLLGDKATKKSIINALRDIANKASRNDYFILNFSGMSAFLEKDTINNSTYFFPFLEQSFSKKILQNKLEADSLLLSLRTLQEYIQLIPANNQLFISEAGPSEKFKSEFIRMLMQNSPEVSSLLNKNRIIIVPNGFGRDKITCNNQRIAKGPINYYITSLDSSNNIYDLFSEGRKSGEVAYQIKSKEFLCETFSKDYFEIFFEKRFLQQYKEIFTEEKDLSRGLIPKTKDVQQAIAGLTAKKYALVVGSDNYKGKGWNKLSNPIKDARAVADELYNSYGFDVQLMEDKPMDSIYKAIREYYRIAQPNDQLVVYFAGHGDVDDELLDDGFIVCSDSKSIDDDPVRNTYIPYAKLQKMLNNIPARQVLVLLDVCHGGSFDAKTFNNEKRENSTSNISNKNVLQFLKDKLPLRTRKFLSSVGIEPAFDGKAGRHSPFANLLLQVLRAKGQGSNGIVTLTDINAVLQTASLNETATLKISPHMANFGNFDAFSEFILIPVEKVNN